jgi:hypothetical protein
MKPKQEVGALLPPPVKKRAPNKMPLLELSGRAEWKQLSPRLKRILTAYISSGGTGKELMQSVVAAFEIYWSAEKCAEAAERILTLPDVVAVLELRDQKESA